MKATNNIAFKEWAVVIHALGTGRQVILLRKGGIHERRGGFTVEHREFFLFPTFFHQQNEQVVPEARQDLGAAQADAKPGGVVPIQFYATAELVAEVDDAARIQALSGLHIWTDKTIEDRYEWGRKQGIFVIGVRVHRLPAVQPVAMLESYGGCKSWVELAQPLPTAGGQPALDDAAFQEKLNRVRMALGS
jgi:hypothetical protein